MTFEELIAKLERISPAVLEREVARKGAAELEKALKDSLSAGTAPDGTAWAPRKEDGDRPYANAASKLTVKPLGSTIRAIVTGPEAWGQIGPRGQVKRPMLPEGGAGMPAEVADALEKASDTVFAEITK